ncbi:dehydrogenase [uncultured Rothia sp.]|uniref:dehydrogenase n=1 Tax=uncultured Rothia sp. TaxID=316088 RepID=UPI0026258F97|nr:dehydrogenase [uncultured Rothia sp.]
MREQAALLNAPEGYLDFHDEYAELIAELAALGFTPTQVLRRLNFLYPRINKKHLNYALNSGIWQFGPVTADAPSYTVLACGLWYVFAEAYDLPPEPEYAALILDCDIIHDLPPALEARHFSNEDIAHVLAKIGATLKYLAAHPYSELEEEVYAQTLEDIRLRGVKEIGTEGGSLYTLLAASMEGESAWPAPAQTVNDYLGDGDWSLGMLRTGICPAEALENEWYIDAAAVPEDFAQKTLSLFLSYCARYDRDPTALNYGYWSTIPTLIEQVPPLGAVRAKFGSWQTTLHRGRTQIARKLRLWTKKDANATAVESGATEPNEAEASAAEELELLDAELTNAELTETELAEPDSPDGGSPAGAPPEPAEPARLSARELTEQGIGVVQTAHTDLAAYHRTQWEQTVEVFGECLAQLAWNRRLSTYYFFDGACLEDADPTPVVTVFRSPTGFLCELEPTVEALPAFDPEFLQEHGWRHPVPVHALWNLHALDPLEAAAAVIEAMRSGCGCERWDFYRTDDDDDPLAEEAEVAPL